MLRALRSETLRVLNMEVEQAHALLVIGDPDRLEHYSGPVVSASQLGKILGHIEVGKGQARLVFGSQVLDGEGYLIEPTAFADVAANERIAQEEIFGPALAVIRAQEWKQPIDIANGTEFGLTGAYYSSHAERRAQASSASHLRTFCVDRRPTGALMAIPPFGECLSVSHLHCAGAGRGCALAPGPADLVPGDLGAVSANLSALSPYVGGGRVSCPGVAEPCRVDSWSCGSW
jgi:acyl-CoA reductase-like NAD-dependent aldehyde dehydrogenase